MSSLHILSQKLLPKQALTRLAGLGARHEGGALTTWVIRRFIDHYRVDMQEAAEPDPAAYRSFNEFFTRALREGARPVADSALVCPVDGTVSQLGAVQDGRIIQAKGHRYSATALLGGDERLAAPFADGQFATIYLSPRDYHRIHMPCAGQLRQMIYVPGELYSVSPATAAGIPGLFARNERVVCLFEGAFGPWALVLVGATIVGSMATVWHGTVNPPRHERIQRWIYPAAPVLAGRDAGDAAGTAGARSAGAGAAGTGAAGTGESGTGEAGAAEVGFAAAQGAPASSAKGVMPPVDLTAIGPVLFSGGVHQESTPVHLDRGQEMGRFMLGSTVVMLFPQGAPALNGAWQPGQGVRMGEAMSA